MSIYVLCNSETILSFMLCYLKRSQWLFIACQRSCGKAMFSVVCVCQSVWQRGLLMWPLPMIHWTSPHRDPPPSPTTYSNLFDLDTSLYSPFTPSQACSNFFNLDFTVPGPFGPALDPPPCTTPPHPDPSTVAKWAVYILLQCFLLFVCFFYYF